MRVEGESEPKSDKQAISVMAFVILLHVVLLVFAIWIVYRFGNRGLVAGSIGGLVYLVISYLLERRKRENQQ